ncbi:hypothetical protein SPRG_05446 [Saprolegnia parasitica CBS 223.65]|uniref:Insulin-degrading enzyme n=1 Tax=Saprolegnia parasitica (strain CBS 223.65) TaxID=695850 RepID=A0A067CRW4_SAPPC|nr:hypothetical protein SPRG_05446 [Saprolegnia parasitica CBS 223.65]KDO29251.1 hypothetical protein SPRG_05446 [Saprolegnia parasitica CBS 223.65]|eukprot:XP_012200080.1 hypothetical protein SPRG_05446 [Saprolegnia parasitica CBS 223.65]
MGRMSDVWGKGSKWVGGLEVSRNDSRLYRSFQLPNKLRVLLVSDAATEKAAAALAVGVGHQADPPHVAGLAHFLEHMLFLGTAKYPDETSYKTYLSAHGGRSNASTSAIATTFYFDVAPPHLHGALDRFAQFFIAPLFSSSATNREMHAVDAEHAKNVQDDARRLYQLSKELANPAHPFHKFGTGNLETLSTQPTALGIDVRAELLAFHARYYSANAMNLVVYGRDDLDTLESWTTSLFSPIQNADARPHAPPENVQPYEAAQQGRLISVVPVRDLRTLELTFPLPSLQAHFLDKPQRVLSHLLGHEGVGSLCADLKARGLANGVSTGLTRDYADWSQFSIKILLTPRGLDAIPDVVQTSFQYIARIAQAGDDVLQRIFDEAQTLSMLQLRYRNQEPPISYVSYLTRNLQLFPAERAVSGPYVLDQFDATGFRRILQLLTPHRLRLLLVSQSCAPEATEPWLGARYSDAPLDPAWIAQWQSATASSLPESLQLPRPNPFLPSQLHLVPETAAVNLLVDAPTMRLWHKQGTGFDQPKASARFKWYTRTAYATPLAAVLTELYTLWLDDVLATSLYDAHVAGIKVHVSNTIAGVTLHIAGYSESLQKVLDAVWAHRFAPMERESLRRLRDALERDLANTLLEEPHRWAVYQRQLALTGTKWSVETKLNVLQAVPDDDLPRVLAAHAVDLFTAPHVETLMYGNLLEEDVHRLVQTVHPSSMAAGGFVQDVPDTRNFALTGDHVLQLPCLNGANENGATHVAFECGSDSTEARATSALLAQVLKVPCFTTLRTTEQLGYIVSSSAGCSYGVAYVYVTVQSKAKTPAEVTGRIQAFLSGFRDRLAAMHDDEWRKHKAALVGNLLEQPKTYEEASARVWEEIASQTYAFDRRRDVAAAVDALSKAQVEEMLDARLVTTATRKALWTQVWPSSMTRDATASSALTSIDAFHADRPLHPARTKGSVLTAKL